MSGCLVWIFGRGASAACGLTWTVPIGLKKLDRDSQVSKIKLAIGQEMNSVYIDTIPYKNLLNKLGARTNSDWCHRFITTNWDYLLQREIENLDFRVAPRWLPNTHVFHLNGSVEKFEDNGYSSPFLLETDAVEFREQTVETNVAFNHLIWQQTFIVVGMSFSCEMDRSFLGAIRRVEDDLPIGESHWLILNRNKAGLKQVRKLIKAALPQASLNSLLADFGSWTQGQMDELVQMGVLDA